MSKQRALVVLVVADIFLAFATMGAELFFHWTLPGPLQEFATSSLLPPASLLGVLRVALWAGSIGTTLVAWVGLLNHWWFARRLYVVAWSIWTLLVLLSGPSVLTPVGATFDTLEALVGGAILGLVYASDLSRQFVRSEARVTNGAPAAA